MVLRFLSLRGFLVLALAVSTTALAVALAMQYVGGLAPCPMCIQQRWGFAAAGAIAVLGLVVAREGFRFFVIATGIACLTTFGLAFRHVGVEAGWWSAAASCLSVELDATTVEELKEQLMATSPARCDEVAARFLGLSIAGWSAFVAFGLAALAGLVFLGKRGRGPVS